MLGLGKGIWPAWAMVLVGCAQIGSPGGGPKDEKGPVIRRSVPANFSTQVQASRIELVFDEFISLKSPQKEVLVSPPFERTPEFRLKGKKLYVTWETPLRENTTYNLNFGKAIVDFNEGNPLDSNLFVFSTGPFLDSGSTQGKVTDAYTGKPLSDISVMLFPQMEDSVPALQIPYYYTRTNKEGAFSFQYLSRQPYFLFALDDKNGNYRYDLPNEQLAFAEQPIDPGSDSVKHHLRMFTVAPAKQFIKSFAETEGGVLQVVTSLPMAQQSFRIAADSGSWEPYHQLQSESLDTFRFWTSPALRAQMLYCILDREETKDTTRLKRKIYTTEAKPVLGVEIYAPGHKIPYYAPIRFKINRPVISMIEGAGAWVTGTSDTTFIALQTDSSDRSLKSLILSLTPVEDQHYKIILPDSQFAYGTGKYNDSLKADFRSDSPLQYAALNLRINKPSSHFYLLELLDEKEVAVRRLYGSDTLVVWDHLKAGKYSMRLILDTNSNGSWDTGSFIPRRQPEPVYYYTPGIDLREGWDQELDWTILDENQ